MALVNSLRLAKHPQPGSSECIPAQHNLFANTVSTIIIEPSLPLRRPLVLAEVEVSFHYPRRRSKFSSLLVSGPCAEMVTV
jgi:hypothetical protein